MPWGTPGGAAYLSGGERLDTMPQFERGMRIAGLAPAAAD